MASLVEQIQAARNAPAGGSLVERIQAARSAVPTQATALTPEQIAEGYQPAPADYQPFTPDQVTQSVGNDPRTWVDRRLEDFNGATDTIGNAFTLGLRDEVGALGDQLGSAITGQPRTWEQSIDTARAPMQSFAANHPEAAQNLSVAGGLAGGLATAGGMTPAASFIGRLAQNVGVGAGTGAVAGFGSGEGDAENRMLGALRGGALGGLLSGVATGVPAFLRGAGNMLGWRNPEQRAVELIARRAGDVNDLATAAAARPGEPLAMVGSRNLPRLAGSASRAGGEAADITANTLDDLAGSRGARAIDPMRNSLGNPEDFAATVQAIDKSRATRATPYYDRARAANPPVSTAPILQKIDDRLVDAKGGIKTALERARSLFMGSDGAPDTSLVGLHETKLALDNMIASAGIDTSLGRVARRELVDIKNDLVTALKASSKDYEQGTAIYAGDAASADALQAGRAFAKGDYEDALEDFAALSPGDKDIFRLGVSRQLRDIINQRGGSGRVLTEDMRERLRGIFPDQASYNAFIRGAENLRDEARRAVQITGGSQTAERTADDAGNSAMANDVINFGANVATGNAPGAIRSALGSVVRRAQGINEPTAAAIARRLMTRDPAERDAVIAELLQAQLRQRQPPPLRQGLLTLGRASMPGLLGGVVGPTSSGQQPILGPLLGVSAVEDR